MSAIVKDLTWGTTERGVELSNSLMVRPIKDNSWNVLRICMRWSCQQDTGSAPTSGAEWAVGLCSGSTNCMGDASETHFLGMGNWGIGGTALGMTRWSVAADVFSFGQSGNPYGGVWKAGVFTPTSTNMGALYSFQGPIAAATQWYGGCMFLTIDRTTGTPYTLKGYYNNDVNINASWVDEATYLAQAEAATPSISNHGASASPTVAVDEATDGTLDHVNIWWNRSAPTIFIHDVRVLKLS